MQLNKNKKEIKKSWIYRGLSWGLFMYIFSITIIPFLTDQELTSNMYFINIPVWIIGGLGYGFIMDKYEKRKNS